jgi:CDP-glycerol glycerophosphotransferase
MQNNKIFVKNFNGKGYGDSPKYIIAEILRRDLDFKIVWECQRKYFQSLPNGIIPVAYRSIKAFYHEVTAKIWIDNCRKQIYELKRKGQYYIQTWHGGIGLLKLVEKDAENMLTPYYKRMAKRDSKIIDLFLSGSKAKSNLIKSSFWYNGEIFEYGYPRNDILINYDEQIISKVYDHFHLNKSVNIILYAPTFRNIFNPDVYDFDYTAVLGALKEKYNSDDWVILIRLHPNISGKSKLINYNDTILNASFYNDMQELLLATDILITDYSGSLFDFSIMKKPVFLFAKDYDEYIKERDFYVDLASLPYPLSLNNKELLECIRIFDKEAYTKRIDTYFQELGLFGNDGNAARHVVDRIIKKAIGGI